MADGKAVRLAQVAAAEAEETGITAYLGVPLRLPSGICAGVFSVIDHQPRDWTDAEETLLQELALSVVTEIRLRSTDRETAQLQREQAERALWDSEAQLHAIFDEAAVSISVVDRSGRTVRTNAALRAWLGYTEPDLARKLFTEFSPPEDVAEDWRRFQELMAGQRAAYQLEKRYRCKDGRIVWGRLTVSAVRAPDGIPQFAVRMVEDITERRRAEVQNSAFQGLGQLLNATTTPKEAARTVLDVADRLFGWDACWLELFDPAGGEARTILTIDEVYGQRVEVRPTEPDIVPSPLSRRAIAGGPLLILRTPAQITELTRPATPGRFEEELPFGDLARPSGSILCVPIRNGSVVVGAISIQSYALGAYSEEDLLTLQALADYCAGALQRTLAEAARQQLQEQLLHTQRQEAEALREQARLAAIREEIGTALAADADLAGALREALQPLVKHLPIAFARVWTLDGTGKYLQMQASAGQYAEDSGPLRLVKVGQTEIGRLVSEQRPLLDNDVAGHPEWALSQGIVGFAGYPLLADGEPVGALGVFSHAAIPSQVFVTLGVVAERLARFVDRTRSAQALQEMQARFSAFMDHTPALAMMRDEEGRYVYVNRQFERTYGLTLQELRGKTPDAVFPPESALLFRANDAEMLRHDAPREFHETVPLPNGRSREYLAIKFPVRDAQGRRYVGAISTDVTERLVLEEQLRQTQKLEAVGRLAGGVAHDFNNILGVINGYAVLLQLRPELPESCRKPLVEIQKAGERAAALTRQLLAFSRKQIIQPQVLQVDEVVANIHSMLLRVIGEDIQLLTQPGGDQARIKADPGQLEQVLLNLVVNARDAMPRGGRLFLRVTNVHLDAVHTKEGDEVPAGPYVCLSVTDTGCGIAPDILAHIFEPFYTTKPVGQGTGLGLATVYGIVRQNHGHIEVESQPTHGATFRLYFPYFAEPLPRPMDAAPPPAPRGQETVLVVEDEEMLRRLVCTILRSGGYNVLAAADGDEAQELCEEQGTCIDLLLTDVVMPGRGGPEVATLASTCYPQLKVLYMSGYTDDAILHHGVHTSEVHFIQKPFTPGELAQKVREVLDLC
jgi:PAS domain S-box-containing protein